MTEPRNYAEFREALQEMCECYDVAEFRQFAAGQRLLAWIGDEFRRGTRHEAVTVSRGNDCSMVAKATDEPYDLTDYETVGDFLRQPWRTVATHAPGGGWDVESLWGALREEAHAAIAECALQLADETERGLAMDYLSTDEGAHALYMLDQNIGDLPLAEVLEFSA